MSHDQYVSFTLTWEGNTIEVSYQENSLNSGHWHLELRCVDPLPVTTTGYRSSFLSPNAIADASAIEGYVRGWLDHAAQDPMWLRFIEEQRQLKLF